MKARVVLTGFALVIFLSGCVAVPPLITVNHRESANSDLQSRVESLERRVRDLESK